MFVSYSFSLFKNVDKNIFSLSHELEEKPFDLAQSLFQSEVKDLLKSEQLQRIWRLKNVISNLLKKFHVDWFGIYRLVNYQGQKKKDLEIDF